MDAQISVNDETSWGPPEPEVDFSSLFGRVISALRRRWLLIAAIILVIFGSALIVVMLLTPKYEAVTRIKIDPSRSAAMGQMTDQQSGAPDQAIVDTEVTTMRSLDVARAVVVSLGLDHDAEFTKGVDPLPANASPAETDEHLNAVASKVLRNTDASREKTTYIIDLSTISADPVKAARIANTFAAKYIELGLGRRSSTAGQAANFIDKRLKELSDQAAAADTKLAEYRAQAGVVTAGGSSSTLIDQQIAPLSTQLATAQSEAAAATARVRSAEAQIRTGNIDGVSAVLASDVIRNLRAQRAQLMQEQGEILTRYGPKHPEAQRITQQLADVDSQIKAEADRIIAGIRADASSAAARAQSLAADLSTLRQQQSRDTRSSALADTYQRQSDNAKAAYQQLSEKAQASDQAAGSSISLAQIIEKAAPPLTPSKPNKALLLGLALVIAIIVALGAVGLLEVVSSGVKSVDDLRQLGIETLAAVPLLRSLRLGSSPPSDFIITKPMSAYAEAHRSLRSSLLLGRHADYRVVMVASTTPDEGKTTTTLSLARVMAMSGDRVLAIDCDLRFAGLTKVVGAVSEMGLVEVLRGEGDAAAAIQQDKVENAYVLPLKEPIFTAEDIFAGEAMPELLRTLRTQYDWILLDTPPMLGIADARTLAVMVDAVVMVVKWNSTSRGAVKAALELARHDQANLAGAVLSMIDRSSEAYGAHYYSRKYAKYYTPRDA